MTHYHKQVTQELSQYIGPQGGGGEGGVGWVSLRVITTDFQGDPCYCISFIFTTKK